MEKIDLPESPELDKAQIEDLRRFFAGMSRQQLLQARKQLLQDSERDTGHYKSGGAPANVNKSLIAIEDALEELDQKKQ